METQYQPFDRAGNLLKVGDTVRGVTKNSDVEVTGVVDEIRIFNNLNVRLKVGEIVKNKDGDAVSGYQYGESAYLERVPEKQKEPAEKKPAEKTADSKKKSGGRK